MIGRRALIALLGGAAAAWPVVARAQQSERMRRIGLLGSAAERLSDDDSLRGFRQGLNEAGYVERRERARSNIAGQTINTTETAGTCGRTGRPSGRL